MPHLMRSSSGHLALHSSGHLRLRRYFRLASHSKVYWRTDATFDQSGMTPAQQLARLGEEWGANYPPLSSYGSETYVNDTLVGNTTNSPFTLRTFSIGYIYELQFSDNGSTGWAAVESGTVRVQNLPLRLTGTKYTQLVNATAALGAVGTGSSIPTGIPPCDWDTVWYTTNADGSYHDIDTALNLSRYVWVVQLILNADDCDCGSTPAFPIVEIYRSARATILPSDAGIIWGG